MIASGFVDAGVSVIIASRKEESLKEVADELSPARRVLLRRRRPVDGGGLPRRSARRWPSGGTPRHPREQRRRQLGRAARRAGHASPGTGCSTSTSRASSTPPSSCCRSSRRPAPPRSRPASSTSARSTASRCRASRPTPTPRRRPPCTSSRATWPSTSRPPITVNAIAPGPFQSRMMRATLEAAGDGMARMMPLQAHRPTRGHGRPGDLPVARRPASFMTGTIIPVDGGIATTK